jgi:hypothetical protein
MNSAHSLNIIRCGFCGLSGHNIIRCNNHRIPDILNTSQMYVYSVIDDPYNIINYRNYLTNAHITTIKLLANRNSISSVNSRSEMIELLLRKAEDIANHSRQPIQAPSTPPNNMRRILLSPEPINEYRRNHRPTVPQYMDDEFIALPPVSLEFPMLSDVDTSKKSIIVFYSFIDTTTEPSDCPICFNAIDCNNQTITNCNHKFCCVCVKEIISRKKPIIEDEAFQTICCDTMNCPLCRTEINELSTLNNTDLVKEILKL